MEWFNYLLKVSACSALFFAFYLLVLRRLTFFKINRFYLLFTLLLSFVIPTLQFTVEREVELAPIIETSGIAQNESSIEQFSIAPISTIESSIPIEEPFNWFILLPYLYATVVLILLGLAAWRLFKLMKHAKQNTQEINGLKLVPKSDGFTNCSFFNYVFIDENSLTEIELQVLLTHEEVHAKMYHSIDKLLLMIVKAVLWFNPIVYLYDKALEQTHEYEADEATSRNFGTASYANLLLRLAVTKSDMPLVHNFVKSPIKERIKMLYHSKSKQMKKLMYLLALPIGLGLLWGFTVDVIDVMPKTEKEFTLILDAGHGGKQIGAQVDGVKEKDIALVFANKVKALAEAKGIKVITTREGDRNISLNDRVKANGDVLLSLHVNSEPLNNGGKSNGIEMFTAIADESLKSAQANLLSNYLFKGMLNVEGIRVKKDLQSRNLFLLRESKVPGLILELGYLTNKSDLKFITNEAKQDELAAAIVNGIELYKEHNKISERLKENKSGVLLPIKILQNSMKADSVFGKKITGKVVGFDMIGKTKIFNLKSGDKIYPISLFGIDAAIKVGDELIVAIYGKTSPPMPIGEDTEKWQSKNKQPDSYITFSIFTTAGKKVYLNEPKHYAFGYEVNKARYASSKIKSIQKNSDGTINRIVLNDKGFTINLNVADQKFKSNNFKTGDAVLVKFIGEKLIAKNIYTTDKMIALYSLPKKYELKNPALYNRFYNEDGTQKVEKLNSSAKTNITGSVIPKIEKPELINSSRIRVDSKMEVSYITNGVMKIYGGLLEAKEITFDQKNNKVIANIGSLKNKNGEVIKGELFTFDLIKGTIDINKSSGNVNSSKISISGVDFEACTLEKIHFSSLAANVVPNNDLLSKFNLKARDSVVSSKYMTTYFGSATFEFNGVVLSGDKIEVDKKSYDLIAYNAELSGVDKSPIKAKTISYNPITKKGKAIDILLHNGYWDRIIN